MKRFIKTKFFLALQEASQKGFDLDSQVLQNRYNKFVLLLFSESAAFTDKAAYHNALVYTRVELAGLTRGAGKKYRNLSRKSYWTC
jgi:hypothetical protein